jgi:hypothetical protein
MKGLYPVAAAMLLTACAGGPVAILSSPNARTVVVDGKEIVVSPLEQPGMYAATFGSFLANNLYVSPADKLVRKGQYARAIELATKCRIVDSVLDDAAATLQAAVKC